MQIDMLKKFADRTPFRPFTIRLSNGATYSIREPRDFGAPRDAHTLVYFGERDLVLIDPLHVVEIVDQAQAA